jgi:CDP-diacylglycerol--glycerol-3-phosphate 3-phosphatidyltransferase
MILPNHLSIARVVLTPVFLFLFLSGEALLIQLSLLVYIIAALTDWYDGWLARKFNYITQSGKFLDPLADKILTAAAFFAFVYIDIIELWMVWLVVIRDFLITGLRLVAEFQKKPMRTSKLAKWKTFIQMIFIYYLLTLYVLSNVDYFSQNYSETFNLLLNTDLIYASMLFVTLFTLYTGIEYLIKNRKLILKLFINEN